MDMTAKEKITFNMVNMVLLVGLLHLPATRTSERHVTGPLDAGASRHTAPRGSKPRTTDRISETEGSPDDPDGNQRHGEPKPPCAYPESIERISETEGSPDDPDGNGGD